MHEHKQEQIDHVTLSEYNDSRAWRAEASELAETLHHEIDDAHQRRGRFTMRLLESDRQGAHDQLVEIVGADDVGNDEEASPLVVTVRLILAGGDRGPAQTHRVSQDGIILNPNSSTPNFEQGYFVGGEGIGEDELQDFTMELRLPKKEVALKALASPQE